MNRALLLLLWFRLCAWLRRLFRSAATPRGAVFLIAGVLFFAAVIGPNIIFRLVRGDDLMVQQSYTEHTRRVGPLMLLAYCVLTVMFASAEQGISFTPAEVQFLFTGPFSRRQLLAYKIIGNSLLCCLYALLLALFFAYAARPLAAYPGLVLTLWFIQFFSMAVSLVISTLGARAVSVPRKVLLAVLIGVVVWGVARLGGDAMAGGPAQVMTRLEKNVVVQALLAPMDWFVQAFTAERLWPDFAQYAAGCLAVDGALLVVVFLLDAQYLEAVAAASERAYERMQRVRSGGAVAAVVASGRPRLRLPTLPYWGGIGPLAWRQLTTAVRSLRPVVIFMILFTIMVGGSRLALGTLDRAEAPAAGPFIGSIVLGMTVAMLTPLLTFDFRGDVDRIDVLKALPLPAWRVALGQLLAPTLILSAVQLLVMVMVQVLWAGAEVLLLVVAVFSLPFNFLSFGMENLMFLWFPARQMPATPGDFQMMGRQMLMMAAKLVALGVVMLPAVLVGLTAAVLSVWLFGIDPVAPALATGCLVMTALASGVVPLVAQAFRHFDVARDTPP